MKKKQKRKFLYVQARLKLWLLRGFSITQLQALEMYKTTRLSVFVHRLRKLGYKIETEMVTQKGISFARYRMQQNKR